jgi:hypothetical protein
MSITSNPYEQVICQHCDEPTGQIVAVTINGGDRKIYDVLVCPGCYEALGLVTPAEPSMRGWHGIQGTASEIS